MYFQGREGGKHDGALVTVASGEPKYKINATGRCVSEGTIKYEYTHKADPQYKWWFNESPNKNLTRKELNKLLGTFYSTTAKVCRRGSSTEDRLKID